MQSIDKFLSEAYIQQTMVSGASTLFKVVLISALATTAIADIGKLPTSRYLFESPWTWVCREKTCVKGSKEDLDPTEDGLPLQVCKLNCGKYGSLLPQPTGRVAIGKGSVMFYPQNVHFAPIIAPSANVTNLAKEALNIFLSYLTKMHPDNNGKSAPFPNGTEVDPIISTNIVLIQINIKHPDSKLSLQTNEAYRINLQQQDNKTIFSVGINANTYFGARHGLETLSQLIAYDDESNCLHIVKRVFIQDSPAYQYRGIILDTSRNFISVPTIKRVIDGMSYNKLNMFHWHITDTDSFPFYSKSVPMLTKYGAYSPRQIYTIEDMKDLVKYATVRGVKIVAEFDAPAHVGNGWQWGPKEGKGNMTVCVNQQPWSNYCSEPPCGQLNPVNQAMYEVLEKLYGDMLEIFDNDLFHMGGDEVNTNCWKGTEEITDFLKKMGKDLSHDSFIYLWNIFQEKALKLLKEKSKQVSGANSNLTAILWTSDLVSVEHALEYVNKSDYIIQIWTSGNDKVIPFLLKNGYRVIFSNYDAWYLDCGYGSWVGGGPNNWCSPYKGWQQVYENSPLKIYASATNNKTAEQALRNHLILGGEAALWTEQVDGTAVDSKLFPRASALAERLWSNPSTGWRQAERRMVHNRQRFVERGIFADRLQPEWCHQNENQCSL